MDAESRDIPDKISPMRWLAITLIGGVLLCGCGTPRSGVSVGAPNSGTTNSDANVVGATSKASSWKTIARGVALCEFQTNATSQDLPVQITALRVAPGRVHIVSGDKLEASQWRQKSGAIATVNGGYFDPEGRSLGLRISDNKRLHDLRPADWGVFLIEGERARIIHTRDYKALRDKGRTHRVLEAVQCGPRLVVDGQLTKLKPQWARRTALGIDRSGRVVVAVADGELSFAAWQKLWATTLNCPNALNLDGGGSTQMSLQSGNTAREISGSWPIPDAVCIR